jgi:hypothetical protein
MGARRPARYEAVQTSRIDVKEKFVGDIPGLGLPVTEWLLD